MDSHTQFTRGWDTYLIGLHHRCSLQSEFGKAIVTTYPAGFEAEKISEDQNFQLNLDSRATLLRATHFDKDGMLRIKSSRLVYKTVKYTQGMQCENSNEHKSTSNKDACCLNSSYNMGDDNDHDTHTCSNVSGDSVCMPIKSLFWAAGFSFTTGDVIKQCPYDPNHKGLFFGEEQAMAARLWTNGYDFYSPPQQVCTLHHYSQTKSLHH